jgi:hypothetical protein
MLKKSPNAIHPSYVCVPSGIEKAEKLVRPLFPELHFRSMKISSTTQNACNVLSCPTVRSVGTHGS